MEYTGYLAVAVLDDSTGVLHGRVVAGGPYPVAAFEATGYRSRDRPRMGDVVTLDEVSEQHRAPVLLVGLDPQPPPSTGSDTALTA